MLVLQSIKPDQFHCINNERQICTLLRCALRSKVVKTSLDIDCLTVINSMCAVLKIEQR